MSEESHVSDKISMLSDGTAINKFCLGQFDDLVMNMEIIWDVFDIITKLSRLNVTKDENGFVKDAELIMPRISEVAVLWAIKNFVKCHEMRSDSISPETILELRRLKLEKYFREE